MTYFHRGLQARAQTPSPIHFFVAAFFLSVIENNPSLGFNQEAESFLRELQQYEVVHPSRVDAKGHFLSNFLFHHAGRIQRREAPGDLGSLTRVFYQLQHDGHNLHFNLTLNPHLLAPGFLTERRYGGLEGAKIRGQGSLLCHLSGDVWDEASVKGSAAISTCNGLTGLFKLTNDEFFIRPLEQSSDDSGRPQAHVIYKRHASSSFSQIVQSLSGEQAFNSTCGVKDPDGTLERFERQRERWERRQRRKRKIRQRSISREKWVETLVVADAKMVEYHGSGGVESYILAIMNIVSLIFRDASIGNAVNIVVVRLILLEKDEEELKITHHADNSLSSFCKWQKRLNMKGDEHPVHHDVAVLLTRKDICAAINKPCETLGLSHVAGMCQPHRSCSISEDTGLPLSFTIAHELGHKTSAVHCGAPWGQPATPSWMGQWMGPGVGRTSGVSMESVWQQVPSQNMSTEAGRHGVSGHPVLEPAGPECRTPRETVSTLCQNMEGNTVWVSVGGTGFVTVLRVLLDSPRSGTTNAATLTQCLTKASSTNGCKSTTKMLDAVIDGTKCLEGSTSRDMCINGICKNVGCDYEIDSNAVEDRCGICNGNGSTCETVKKTFEESEGLGYVDIGLIPEGARDIRIEEVAEAGNFLALRSDDPEKYFLNGGWTIQWNGDYKVAGTIFTYERTGHLENLTSPGPTMEPVWIQLLFQETNPGVRYEYTISREVSQDSDNNIPSSDFFWKFGSWTECSTTCGIGVQRQIVHCVEKTSGIVEEHYCDPLTRPDDKRASCNEELCPAIWWVGEWQKCSALCGSLGLAKRTVLCIQAVGLEEQRALQPSQCQHMPKPVSVAPCNTHILCPADWTEGNWSECSLTCGSGVQTRNVTCSRNTGVDCDLRKKPSGVTPCYIRDCPQVPDVFGGSDWSGSGSFSKEVFNKINSIPDANSLPKYSTTRAQPKDRNKLYNRMEGDFSPRNTIEKAQNKPADNNVKVDDFYYDYNFIKFHEDLSYDFDSGIISQAEKNSIEQEPKPNSGVEENIDRETSLLSNTPVPEITTSYHLQDDKQQKPRAEDVENSNSSLKKLVEMNQEKEDDLFSEDYFLPIANTPPPPGSTTKIWKESNSNLGLPLNPSTAHSLVLTTKVAPVDIIRSKHEEKPVGDKDFFQDFSQEKSNYGNIDDTVEVTTPVKKVYKNEDLPSVIIGREKEKAGELGYSYYEKTTAVLQFPDSLGETDSRAPHSHFPLSATMFEVKMHEDSFFSTTLSEWDKTMVETISITTSLPYASLNPTSTEEGNHDVLSPEEKTHFDQQDFSTDPNTVNKYNNLGITEGYTVTSHLVSQEKPPPTPAHLRPLSESQENINAPWTTRKDTLLPTHLESIVSPPPSIVTQTQPAAKPEKEIYTPSFPHYEVSLGQTDSSLLTPSTYLWNEMDHNEILIPPRLQLSGTDHPSSTFQPLTDAVTTVTNTATLQDGTSPTSTTQSHLSLHSLMLQSQTIPTPNPAAYWVTGNWSACSTSCGLGAIWRMVVCSSGKDTDCDLAKKPVPARRCYLRPCSAWKTGQWSQCSKKCGGGVTLREVQCFDTRDQRPLRPFHCQPVSPRPTARLPCNPQPCLEWYSSSWGQCSEVCGGGEQQRLVTCPEEEQCDEDVLPSNIQACNSQVCAQWVTGSWGQCSASCGGGVQRRLVKCVNLKSDTEEEEEHAQCDHESCPENTQKCNIQECENITFGVMCVRDRLTFRFCQTLQWLGHCNLPTVRVQCCRTCSQRSRGNERTSRR
ncbi:A disintegrin and metalloproteinase with thrombospondin motifs 7 isoform X5 [Hypomesus transpacificus]|uniref:A disintegrin and metalloproteinase with thrombospondin motifs 7 isoform X5 n=1 Tax=Hypomesus transpacificus TaxID=137520 RepID=UPI001F088601|nr:A disintegrin and metalloproteinase with thrombospondin motifs 7 isoform X5 [Hypomesus transpacificus]